MRGCIPKNLTKYEIQALLDKIHQTIVVVGNDAGW